MAVSTRTQFQGVRQHMVQGIHFLCSTGNLDKHNRQSYLETERQKSGGPGRHTPSENTVARKYSISVPLSSLFIPYLHTLTTAEQLFSLPPPLHIHLNSQIYQTSSNSQIYRFSNFTLHISKRRLAEQISRVRNLDF